MWMNDPDGTAHSNGIGSDLTRKSLTLVDSCIGRIEDTLRAKGLLESHEHHRHVRPRILDPYR